MEAYFERLAERAATLDERLSDDFEPLPARQDDADLAARRLAAWCRASANGDRALFVRRLERDGWSLARVQARLATLRRKAEAAAPAWVTDAVWIDEALQAATEDVAGAEGTAAETLAFQDLLLPLVEHAESRLWADIGAPASDHFAGSARASLRRMLLHALTDLCAVALYERFAKARTADAAPDAVRPGGTSLYRRFAADMKAGGFRELFDEKPVLLRLIATLTRQWIDCSREFADRLDADLPALRRDLLPPGASGRVVRIDGDLADRHNGGRSVLIVAFEDGSRVVYKPKDLRLDVAWHDLIARLNRSAPPLELRAVRAIARQDYGWTEFIEHTGCTDPSGPERFYRRAGALLALFHCFAATDMHQENLIAAGDQPVPIDLETLFQSSGAVSKPDDPDGAAWDAAADIIANSVMRVGLLPAYGRGPDNSVFAVGGLTSDWNSKFQLAWTGINSDEMRPERKKIVGDTTPNLPHIDGRYAKFPEHFDAFLEGFEAYAKFLSHLAQAPHLGNLFEGFAGVPVRKVVRPTRFYSMLLLRLKNHRIMDDGATWSAETDFVARLSDWEASVDANWPFLRAERAALVTLNVPHFVLPSDGNEVRDAAGIGARSASISGLERARDRLRGFDAKEIAWQCDVIRANAEPAKAPAAPREIPKGENIPLAATRAIFIPETNRIAAELSARAIRRGNGAAWIGLDWLGDAESYQLVNLGADLYNGVSGIGVFLAAHARVAGHEPSAELARAAVAYLRKRLKDRNAARLSRLLGIGGAAGLGSILYALTVMADSLGDEALRADAYAASQLITDELIAADKRLDVIGGSAGAILALLRLHRDTGAEDVLRRAIRCGEHLLRQDRVGLEGRRSWMVQGFGTQGLNGMSHGAAGFAYALASLASATGREDFSLAAAECIAFENASYDADRKNWPDRRHAGEPGWACRWCHGAPGIGMSRAGLLKRGVMQADILRIDIHNAIAGSDASWPTEIDTLCCGTLGIVEFFCEAADAIGNNEVRDIAAQRLAAVVQAASLAGDYRWNSGKGRFNLGLFRGLAGIGYTLLRRVDNRLPNILIWE